jgi:hypothetical protein
MSEGAGAGVGGQIQHSVIGSPAPAAHVHRVRLLLSPGAPGTKYVRVADQGRGTATAVAPSRYHSHDNNVHHTSVT